MLSAHGWFYWALLSAVFAAMTAIFAKIGLEGVDSDYATLIRTFVILLVLAGFVYSAGKWSDPFALNPKRGYSCRCPDWLQAHHGCAIFAHCNPAKPPRSRPWTSSAWCWLQSLRSSF